MEYFNIRSSTIVKMENIQVNEIAEVLKEIIIKSLEQKNKKK